MQRRHFLTAMAAPLLQSQLTQAQGRRLNILFITADDLGLVLSSYGEKRIRTPNLDRFAESAVRFKTAYVAQASCSPSRSAMFTGLFPHANGQYGLMNGGFRLHDTLTDKTIPNVLKKAGYRTGILGKLHVDPEASFAFDVRDTQIGGTRRVREMAKKAEEFLDVKGDAPFFLMLNFGDPHAFRNASSPGGWNFPPQVDGLPEHPLQPSEKTLFSFQNVDTPAQRERTANYLNAVSRLDDGIGLVFDALRRTGHDEDTLVVFCGDHGPPFARGKTTCYEAGLRVPFIVRWPGVSRRGVSEAMVSTTDIAPTIYDAAGIEGPPAHGRSLRALVVDTKAKGREYLAGEFQFHGAAVFYPRRAIRDSRYKLIHNIRAGEAKPSPTIDGDAAFENSRDAANASAKTRAVFDTFADPPEFELYDLRKDPDELENLAGRPGTRAIQERLQAALLAWRKDTSDPFLEPAFVKKYSAYKLPAKT